MRYCGIGVFTCDGVCLGWLEGLQAVRGWGSWGSWGSWVSWGGGGGGVTKVLADQW